MNNKSHWFQVAAVNEIESDEPLPVDVGDIEIALCKVDDKIYAVHNICTHEYACMSDGFIDGDNIECPLHQAQFHIPTGKALTPPAEIDLKVYPVKVENEFVFVKVKDTAEI